MFNATTYINPGLPITNLSISSPCQPRRDQAWIDVTHLSKSMRPCEKKKIIRSRGSVILTVDLPNSSLLSWPLDHRVSVVYIGLFWFYFVSFSYNGVYFLWFIFNRRLAEYLSAHSFWDTFLSAATLQCTKLSKTREKYSNGNYCIPRTKILLDVFQGV